MSPVDKSPKRPNIWRSLRERNNEPEFLESVQHEFVTPPGVPEKATEQAPNGRRRFLQMASASAALAAASTGCRWEEQELLPLNRRPEGRVPGMSQFFSSAMELAGVGVGTLISSYDGRPIKVEGNPGHPSSLGACGVFQQAATLELYDPDRSKSILGRVGKEFETVSAEAFGNTLQSTFTDLRASKGSGLAVLAEHTSSPTQAAQKKKFQEMFPLATWVDYEPVNEDNVLAGSQLAFGQALRTHLAPQEADVIVALDCDLLGDHPDWIPLSRGVMRGRDPETGKMNRLYSVESAFTMTGGLADNRLPLRSQLIKAFVVALDSALTKQFPAFSPGQPNPNARFLESPAEAAMLSAIVEDLVRHPGRSVVAVGAGQPPEVHALVHRINAMLGNIGKTVTYTTVPPHGTSRSARALDGLVHAMNAQTVTTLVILGGNPVYNAPADIDFAGALVKVKNSIHLSLYVDETSLLCSQHYPQAHWLESWGDSRAYDGTVSITQPLIAPLYNGKSKVQLLAAILGEEEASGQDLIKATHGLDDRAWRSAVHDGVVPGTAWPKMTPSPRPLAPLKLGPEDLALADSPGGGALDLQFAASPTVYDGRYANNGWLQETPDVATALTWENSLTIAPKTAKQMGLTDGDIVRLAFDGRELPRVPVQLQPGQAPGTVRLLLGYGRTAAGRIGGLVSAGVEPAGVSAYKLRTTKSWDFGPGATLEKVDSGYRLPTLQDVHAIDTVGRETIDNRVPVLIRQTTLAEFKKDPKFAQHYVHTKPNINMWKSPVSYDGEKWGMSIDLGKCIGCAACITACTAENNVPVVGKERVLQGREMHWIAVQRYYMGDEDNPDMAHQPLTCHQCENAPCEQVCPVGATLHSVDGLNDMTYNRCIGTRYCSNNCPYKVRRFNYFNLHEDLKDEKNEVKKMVFNPEVTVRFRGVMEKCTFCVQRIRRAKLDAKTERRPVQDQEILSACQQTCPTEAIVFGDLNKDGAKVAKLQASPRSYAMLGELNVIPRLQYLAKITNPNPALTPASSTGDEKAHH